MGTMSVTNEFAQEFEAERTIWFRKRFLWYTGTLGSISIIATLFESFGLVRLPESAQLSATLLIIIFSAQSLIFPAAFFYVHKANQGLTRKRLIRLVFWLLVINALLGIPVAMIQLPLLNRIGQTRTLIHAIDSELNHLEATHPITGDADPTLTVHEAGRRAAAAQRLLEDLPATIEQALIEAAPPTSQPVPTDALDTEAATSHTPQAPQPHFAERIAQLQSARALIARQGIASDQDWQNGLAVLSPKRAETLRNEATPVHSLRFGMGSHWILQVMIAHFLASFFIPWTWREAITPLIPALAIYILGLTISGRLFTFEGVTLVLLSPLIGLPGVAVVSIRNAIFQKQFTYKAIRGRYTEMRRELGLARQIHEDLFPPPIETGPIQLRYYYEPMRQIGGDYLHARLIHTPDDPNPTLHLTVMDVTGHGITAALTVNRLHGEMDRILAENPKTTPGQMLIGLNRYMHATLAGHSVYATCICLAVDLATNTLHWASAGHPPAFLRQVNGRIEELHSTTFVLGVTLGEDFDPNEQHIPFHPGDALLAYTDGAIECRNAAGQMLGINGLLAAFSSGHPDPAKGWTASIAAWVKNFCAGPAKDDILLVELKRPIETETASNPPANPD